MAKSRDAVRMSEAEISAFLDSAHSLQVATLGKDGAPHLTTVWFAVHEGDILFETYGKSQKVVNLERDPRIAVLAEDGRTYDQLRGVSINGHAEVIADNPERTALMRVLVDHHFPGQDATSLDEMSARMAQKRVVIRVRADKIMSWDHRKLAGKGP
ncbi:MAG: pyridoxamine 5'-phosphate oxidase family protein [Novosphingobium sp.]